MLAFRVFTRYQTDCSCPPPAIEAPRASTPATGQPVCIRVTPQASNGIFYPFSFQYIFRPSFPSWLNGNPSILFPFIPLQATSSPTGGTPPSVFDERPALRTPLKPIRHRAHPLEQTLALVRQLQGPIMRRLVILAGSLVILSPLVAAQQRAAMSMRSVPARSAVVAPSAASHAAAAGVVHVPSPVRMATRVITSRTRTGGTVVRVIRPANVTRPRMTDNEDVNFSQDFSSAPGLGFDETHFAATRGRRPGAHRRNHFSSGFFPFFDGGFFLPTPVVIEQAPATEVQEEIIEPEPQDRVQRVRPRESAPIDSAEPAPQPQRETEQYVFVRRDGTVFFAIAYSWDSGMLRYVTQEGLRKSVAGDALDLGATQQFNEQRGLSFHAPV
jgi:hypothetical protein